MHILQEMLGIRSREFEVDISLQQEFIDQA